jgi:hypothetical protein
MIGEIKFHAYTHVYIYILYFRTKFLLILEIQYFSLFFRLFTIDLFKPKIVTGQYNSRTGISNVIIPGGRGK